MQARKYEVGRNSMAYDIEFECGICAQFKSLIVNVEIGYSYECLCFDCVKAMHKLVIEKESK